MSWMVLLMSVFVSSDVESMSKRLVSTLEYEKLKKADIVIEAVVEDMSVKHQVLEALEKHTPDHCIFASNTSALSIAKIAQASKRPEQVHTPYAST